jgi:hypothetical protein
LREKCKKYLQLSSPLVPKFRRALIEQLHPPKSRSLFGGLSRLRGLLEFNVKQERNRMRTSPTGAICMR